jgi:hypothetical protein
MDELCSETKTTLVGNEKKDLLFVVRGTHRERTRSNQTIGLLQVSINSYIWTLIRLLHMDPYPASCKATGHWIQNFAAGNGMSPESFWNRSYDDFGELFTWNTWMQFQPSTGWQCAIRHII